MPPTTPGAATISAAPNATSTGLASLTAKGPASRSSRMAASTSAPPWGRVPSASTYWITTAARPPAPPNGMAPMATAKSSPQEPASRERFACNCCLPQARAESRVGVPPALRPFPPQASHPGRTARRGRRDACPALRRCREHSALARHCTRGGSGDLRCCSGIALVLRRCCSLVQPLYIPYLSLVHPLYMLSAPAGTLAAFRSFHRAPAWV